MAQEENQIIAAIALENEPKFGLETLLETTNQRLIEFANSDQFTVTLETAFGAGYGTTDTLQEVLRSGAFFNVSIFPMSS